MECGLKACVLAYVENTGVIFQGKRYAERCFTHDLEALVKAAGLQAARGLDIQANSSRGIDWEILKDWNVDIRYQERSEFDATRLYNAITDDANGVLS